MEDFSIFLKSCFCSSESFLKMILDKNTITAFFRCLVLRCLRYSSDWQICNTELDRIRQVLANNNYPQSMVEEIIRTSLNRYLSPDHSTDIENVELFVQLHNLSTFHNDKKMLRSIVKEHVKPADNNKSIRLHAYFKPFKLKSMFPTRPRKNAPHTSHVVYQFSCNLDGCNASYIGYTTCTMERRAKQHRYKGSGIYTTI